MTHPVGRRLFLGGLGAALAAGLTGCNGEPPDPSKAEPTDALEILSWWTSASERDALKVITDAFAADHPDVTLTSDAVVGGSGSKAQVELATRLADDDPPDVWQGFVGGYLQANGRRKQAADASSAMSGAGMSSVLPAAIVDALSVGGTPYGVPTGSHRGNVLFFHRGVLDAAGVTAPADGYATDAFLADLEAVDASGVVPLGLGGQDGFTSVELFENALLSVIGQDGWKTVADGDFVWSGSEARAALDLFGSLLDRADPRASSLTWDGAVSKLAAGECGFLSMNDSAYGELVSRGAGDGEDIGYVAFPGTDDSYMAVVDVFVAAAEAENLANAIAFLTVAGSAETQLAFSKVKGSIPVRTDVAVDSLSQYQQDAAQSYREDALLLSAAHGESVTPALHVGLYDAVAGYARNRDAGAFADTIENAVVATAQNP